MAKWGKCDFKQLQVLQKKLDKIAKKDLDRFAEDCAKELAARLLTKLIKRTPVGIYSEKTGVKGGTLRRGWTAKSEREAELTAVLGGGDGAKKYAYALPVVKKGNMYEIEMINPVTYAPYVEYGHRTSNHKGWVPGRFMLTISEEELQSQAPKILENKMKKFLEECFNDN